MSVDKLPSRSDVGKSGTWMLPHLRQVTQTRESRIVWIQVTGKLLGSTDSRRTEHSRHEGTYAALKERCAACRWSEFRILRKESRGYVVHTVGGSAVPGEINGYRPQVREALTAPEVLELLTTRMKPQPGAGSRERSVFFPDAAARVLAQASAFDESLMDAWENRRVA